MPDGKLRVEKVLRLFEPARVVAVPLTEFQIEVFVQAGLRRLGAERDDGEHRGALFVRLDFERAIQQADALAHSPDSQTLAPVRANPIDAFA